MYQIADVKQTMHCYADKINKKSNKCL